MMRFFGNAGNEHTEATSLPNLSTDEACKVEGNSLFTTMLKNSPGKLIISVDAAKIVVPVQNSYRSRQLTPNERQLLQDNYTQFYTTHYKPHVIERKKMAEQQGFIPKGFHKLTTENFEEIKIYSDNECGKLSKISSEDHYYYSYLNKETNERWVLRKSDISIQAQPPAVAGHKHTMTYVAPHNYAPIIKSQQEGRFYAKRFRYVPIPDINYIYFNRVLAAEAIKPGIVNRVGIPLPMSREKSLLVYNDGADFDPEAYLYINLYEPSLDSQSALVALVNALEDALLLSLLRMPLNEIKPSNFMINLPCNSISFIDFDGQRATNVKETFTAWLDAFVDLSNRSGYKAMLNDEDQYLFIAYCMHCYQGLIKYLADSSPENQRDVASVYHQICNTANSGNADEALCSVVTTLDTLLGNFKDDTNLLSQLQNLQTTIKTCDDLSIDAKRAIARTLWLLPEKALSADVLEFLQKNFIDLFDLSDKKICKMLTWEYIEQTHLIKYLTEENKHCIINALLTAESKSNHMWGGRFIMRFADEETFNLYCLHNEDEKNDYFEWDVHSRGGTRGLTPIDFEIFIRCKHFPYSGTSDDVRNFFDFYHYCALHELLEDFYQIACDNQAQLSKLKRYKKGSYGTTSSAIDEQVRDKVQAILSDLETSPSHTITI